MNWRDKNILATGGSGFLGTHLVNKIKGLGAIVYAPSHDDFDLVHENEIEKMYSSYPDVDVVIHAASRVGGIGANEEHPGSFFYDNLMMGVQLLHHAYQRHIPKFVALGAVCAYPKYTPVPSATAAQLVTAGYQLVVISRPGSASRQRSFAAVPSGQRLTAPIQDHGQVPRRRRRRR